MQHVPDTKLVNIDMNSLSDTEENPETVIFDIVLSDTPGKSWREEFEYLYNSLPFQIKPPVTIDENRLHVHFIPRYSDHLQPFLEHLAQICHRSTLEARLTEKMKVREDQERRKVEFKKVLQNIQIPTIS
jgi:hypothetical protein